MVRAPHPAPIATLAAKAGAKAFQRYGFTEQSLVTHWTAIMGESLGRMTLPLKLSFAKGERSGGTLRILAEGAAALELQHLAPVVIERINASFGFPAVKALSITQGPAARPMPGPAPEAALSPDAEAALEAMLEPVENDALRRSLARLGRAVQGGKTP